MARRSDSSCATWLSTRWAAANGTIDVTTAQLLAWILGALGLQALAGIGIAAWRRGQSVARAAGELPQPQPLPAATKGAWQGLRKFRVAQRCFEDAAHAQCSFWLEPLDGQPLPPFKPGQFLTFTVDAPGGAGATAVQRITRCYSLSDAPAPDHYRVTIKRVGAPADHPDWPPGVSSNHFHDHVHSGDLLDVRAPAGHFFIDAASDVPVVLIAGGIGITPMMSMLRWCVGERPGRTVHLYYGVRQGAEHAFKADLASLAAAHPQVRLQVVYSQPTPQDQPGVDYQHAGRVDLALLQRTLPHGRHQFYLCGPSAMMESLVPALAQWGVPEADIHYEAFGPASVRLPSAAAAQTTSPAGPFEIRFSRSGRSVSWQGPEGNLLDFAERHGIAVESGCRSGGCGSCETRLVSGAVTYPAAPDHDLKPGHCLLCVGTPTSDLVLEA